MTHIVSYSEVFKMQTCKRQWYYRFHLGLSPEEESEAISTGVKGHKLLQNFYTLMQEGKPKLEALKLVQDQANKEMQGGLSPDYSLVKAWTLVDNYIRATDFTSEAILVENRFLVPVSKIVGSPIVDAYGLHDVQIGFTPDVVFERKGKKVDIEDAKFVQRAWSKKKINRFQQIKLYQILMEAMGYEISRCVLRFFNVATGKIDVQNYAMSKVEQKNVLHDFIEGVREVIEFRSRGPEQIAKAPRTMNYTACQFCHFEFPCSLEAEGKDASRTLATQYVKSSYDYTR